MGLNKACAPVEEVKKYKSYERDYQDQGFEKTIDLSGGDYAPDFESRNTIQKWNITNASRLHIKVWVGETLINSSLHDLVIINNGAVDKYMTFSSRYDLIDEPDPLTRTILLRPGESAHFYCTGVYIEKSLVCVLRKGSQDTRKAH